MSRLKDLIEQLCPNGIDYRRLDDIAVIWKGKQLNKEQLSNSGIYPVINGGVEPSGYWDESNARENTITVSQGGNSAGFVNEMRTAYWAGAHCFVIEALEEKGINWRYLYHAMKSHEPYLMDHKYGAGIPSLARKTLDELELPVPPIAIQEEVAFILDEMQGLCTLIDHELVFRRKQLGAIANNHFHHLFGDALQNNKSWQVLSLEQTLKKGRHVSYGIVKTGDDVEGGVPVFRPVDITSKTKPCRNSLKRTTKEISDKYRRTLLDGDELLLTVRGVIGELFMTTNEFRGCNVGRNIVPLQFDENILNRMYAFFLLKTDEIQQWFANHTKGVAQAGLNMGELRKLPIIVPPMEMQLEFIHSLPDLNIYGEFALVETLESELALRQKQFEYYRDKLLDFPEKVA